MIDALLHKNEIYIVDVGASGGIHPRWGSLTDHHKGVLFEPDPKEYQQLIDTTNERLIVINSALSDCRGSVDFHICRKQGVSSIYRPNMNLLKKFRNPERFDVTETIRIEADTLDTQLSTSRVPRADFLKIDTQGSELGILKGGSASLARTLGLEIEVEFITLYEGQPLFGDVNAFVTDRGFTLIDLRRKFWRRKTSLGFGARKGQLIFGDALYFRLPDAIVNLDTVDEAMVIRAIYLYLAYGYTDLAMELHSLGLENNLISRGTAQTLKNKILDMHENDRVLNFLGRHLKKMWKVLARKSNFSGSDKTLGN